MCPTYAFIDRADGKLNRAMDFKKDYSALISAAWDIDSRYDAYLTNPEEDSYNNMTALGLDEITSEESKRQRDNLIRALVEGRVRGRFGARYIGNIVD